MTYPQKLMLLRSRMGWTQGELATNIGLSQKSVSAIEIGTRKPSRVVALRIDNLIAECDDVSVTFGVATPKDIGVSSPTSQSELLALLANKDSRIAELEYMLAVQRELIEELKNAKKTGVSLGISGGISTKPVTKKGKGL